MPSRAANVDRDVLESLRRRATADAPDFFIEMAAMFVRDIDRRLVTINVMLAQGDLDRVARAAHSLGGSAKLFGAAQLAEFCRQLQDSPHPPLDSTRSIVAALADECALVRQIIIAESRRAS